VFVFVTTFVGMSILPYGIPYRVARL
jgi:hypothetical protein